MAGQCFSLNPATPDGMTRYIAFLRGINLGNRRLTMSHLASLFEDLGYREVETFIASGNVLFGTDRTSPGKLESTIASHLEGALGYQVDTFVRTPDQVVSITRTVPFPRDGGDGATLSVGFLHQELAPEVQEKLESARTPVDQVRVVGREFYWLCRTRTSESKFWALPEVKALRLPSCTIRNLTSLQKLVAKHLAQPRKKA